MTPTRSKADKQKEKAKEMLGISDNRAKEIFEEQPDRKQQKKKELEQKEQKMEQKVEEVKEEPEPETQPEQLETDEPEEVELHSCPECDDDFDSEQGMKVHKGQMH